MAYGVTADGDTFYVGETTLFELAQRGRIPVGSLVPDRRLFACRISSHTEGYPRVGLCDGKKGKEQLHRLVASDVMGANIDGRVVHHEDHDKLNNDPSNLRIFASQSEHAYIHGRELAEKGEHPFQLNRYSKSGDKNGMHKGGAFWSNPEKAKRYRGMKRKEMLDRDPVALQKASTRRRT